MLRILYFPIVLFLIVILIVAHTLAADTYTLDQSFGQVPLSFVINEGQFHPDILFAAEGNACNVFSRYALTTYKLEPLPVGKTAKQAKIESDNYHPIVLYFYKANLSPEITGENRCPWNSNFFIGNDPDKWHTDVPEYGTIRMNDIYDGIDLIYTAVGRRIDFTMVVQPGADPTRIQFRHTYNDEYTTFFINDNGELDLYVYQGEGSGRTVQAAPECYQEIDGEHVPVTLRYAYTDSTERFVKFEFGDYDSYYELIIKPQMIYTSMFAIKNTTEVSGIDVDDDDNSYVTGETLFGALHPTSSGAFDGEKSLGSLFVLKLNEKSGLIDFVSYAGGNTSESGRIPVPKDITVDNSGNSYITGERASTDFPITDNAFDKILDTAKLFILKLSKNGNTLEYSTFLGGNGYDKSYGIVVDSFGQVYVTGTTASENFPTTLGAYDKSFNYNGNGFITKINFNGSGLIYSTFLDIYICVDLEVNDLGDLYITGRYSNKVFVAKLNSEGNNFIFESILEGSENSYSNSIFIDSMGYIYLSGTTSSEDFSVTENAYDNSFNGGDNDCYLVQLNEDGSELLYSTFLGGAEYEYTDGIIVDTAGNIYISGYTRSSDFPITNNAYKKIYDGDWEPFFVKFNSVEKKLIYSSFLGGSSSDINDGGFELDKKGGFYIAGRTQSGDFPLTGGVFDTGYRPSGYYESPFIIKFSFDNDTGINIDKNPENIILNQPYPNPFNSSITISYILTESSIVELNIHSVTGQKVASLVDNYNNSGIHSITYDTSHLASGIYICCLKS